MEVRCGQKVHTWNFCIQLGCHRCRQKAKSYPKYLTLRQCPTANNSQVKQLQSQVLHLNTGSGVTLQPYTEKFSGFKNVTPGVFLSPRL